MPGSFLRRASIDQHVDGLGHRVAEVLKTADVRGVPAEPGPRRVAAAGTQTGRRLLQFFERRLLRIRMDLGKQNAVHAFRDVGKGGQGGVPGLALPQDAQRAFVEEFDGSQPAAVLPQRLRQIQGIFFRLQKQPALPDLRRERLQPQQHLCDDAKRTVAAHEQIHRVHAVCRIVARCVLYGRHPVGRQRKKEPASVVAAQQQPSAGSGLLPSSQGHTAAIRQQHPESFHIPPRRAVKIRAGAGGVAGGHAADAGRRLRRVRREEQRAVCAAQAFHVFAEVHQQHAGPYPQQHILPFPLRAQDLIHASQTGKAIKSAFPTERDSSRRYRACSSETRSIFKFYSLQCSKPYCAKTSGMSHLSKVLSSGSRYQPSSAFTMRAICMAFLPSGASPTA